MELVSQHIKKIMEGCKERALAAGLKFDKETLEYIVTNTDMLELTPKNMIPTLYDYWLQDIQVLRGKGEYEYFPHNPYETVINTRPAISFYNDNNPDWLNVMIFYHVLAHIDFFQNNKFYQKTWDFDFKQKALTEKRMIEKLRSQKGRDVDYVIEFTRGIDNLIGYFDNLQKSDDFESLKLPDKIDYYFNTFLQSVKNVGMKTFLEEVERYDNFNEPDHVKREVAFLNKVSQLNPEFEELYRKYFLEIKEKKPDDLLHFIMDKSSFLNAPENEWMKTVMEIVRDTALYFAPQIRTKTMNEGWASYWHEKLFLTDDRIKGHEIAFSVINAKVTAISRVGLNPYAIGWRLFQFIEVNAEKGKFSFEFDRIKGIQERKDFKRSTGNGMDFIFYVRENFCDYTFLNRFIVQDFIDKNKLMVVGQHINQNKNTIEYYVKSRKAEDYKKMIVDTLYHPPKIKYSVRGSNILLLNHVFEGKELYRNYIHNTLIGLEYLWGDTVELETTELDLEEMNRKSSHGFFSNMDVKENMEPVYTRVLYEAKYKKVNKQKLSQE
jgi:stage V sporulation protein R